MTTFKVGQVYSVEQVNDSAERHIELPEFIKIIGSGESTLEGSVGSIRVVDYLKIDEEANVDDEVEVEVVVLDVMPDDTLVNVDNEITYKPPTLVRPGTAEWKEYEELYKFAMEVGECHCRGNCVCGIRQEAKIRLAAAKKAKATAKKKSRGVYRVALTTEDGELLIQFSVSDGAFTPGTSTKTVLADMDVMDLSKPMARAELCSALQEEIRKANKRGGK